MTRARELSKLANTNVLNVSGTNVGIGTTNPQTALNVVGVVSATSFYGSGANLSGVVTATQAIVGSAVTINSTGINVVGVVTATSFVGSGSQLTGISAGLSTSRVSSLAFFFGY
jgi:hypothetical protein